MGWFGHGREEMSEDGNCKVGEWRIREPGGFHRDVRGAGAQSPRAPARQNVRFVAFFRRLCFILAGAEGPHFHHKGREVSHKGGGFLDRINRISKINRIFAQKITKGRKSFFNHKKRKEHKD